ncbi:hypothetical protein RHGRI_028469 [Rhododendron griersonianum]|uniref:RRM domain-containing protein n=1 Tax=Rhododendron griersonianum TaxID=479676 RepID=A0AAV6ILJ0_9ERIC|nr:hypothetical protein RHGRI_028469 [Rhododendron griersonianum]
MSTSGQPQFRYTQTPSKVLHLRNLPWECTEEELVEVCKPFGKIVNTKSNVGANRNQAFVEFVDLNQAINMVTYYASSSEPAQVRGKHVYIQYSNRHEIVNNAKGPGDVPGNVLLVTIEGVEAGDVSIDVIHLVFSAFGFVHKIATFEKAAGFQVYLLPDHVSSCHLRISYSAHTDLNIKFQSHRSRSQSAFSYTQGVEICELYSGNRCLRKPHASSNRQMDYTNPYLPVNSTAIEGFVQPTVGPDGKIKEPESNVLLASIGNMQYAVTVDVLHTVFATFGTVQKIAIFEKNGGTQALIQYPDVSTAAVAKEALEGHCIYDGGSCKLHLSYSRHTDLNVKAYCDKSRDYTVPESSLSNGWQNPQVSPMFSGNQFSGGGIASAAQAPMGQGPSWDPNIQAGRPTFVSAPGTFPGQTYAPSSVPSYASASAPPGSSPTMQTGQIGPTVGPRGVSQPSHQPNAGPGSTSRPGQPSYYG